MRTSSTCQYIGDYTISALESMIVFIWTHLIFSHRKTYESIYRTLVLTTGSSNKMVRDTTHNIYLNNGAGTIFPRFLTRTVRLQIVPTWTHSISDCFYVVRINVFYDFELLSIKVRVEITAGIPRLFFMILSHNTFAMTWFIHLPCFTRVLHLGDICACGDACYVLTWIQ